MTRRLRHSSRELSVVGDVVLLLLRGAQIVGIDVLKPDEHALDARRHRLLDEAGNLVARRIDLDDEARVDALLAQFDQPVEDRFPVAIAGQIIVGDEEVADAVGVVDPHQRFDIVRGAIARLAALHVDDGAERAQEGTAAPGVEAGDHAERASHALGRHIGAGRALKPRQIMKVIVDRLELARGGVAQHFVESPFRFARIERNPEVERFFERIRRLRQHGEAARDMESADDNRDPGRPKRPSAVHHPRELIRLHADETDHAKAAVVLDLAGDALGADAGVGLVDGEDLDVHVLAKNLIFHAFLRDAKQAGERIRGQRRLPPLDDIALVVVVRRLDQEQQKSSTRYAVRHPGSPRNDGPPNSCPAFAAIGDPDRYQSSPESANAALS